jgi:hypothetical protein
MDKPANMGKPAAMDKPARRIADQPVTMESLMWLLVSLMMVIAPHADRMPFWITGAFILCGVWRFLAQKKGWRLPGKWM